ncbi:RNA polymerase sigma-70 factor [Parabacteroides sp. TM07-1AC]|uniref:RNA polymerase sigma-70 factor n=1 Tax=unclassified Parabacteroides TaxID=2649774 RepID=UPI000EFE8891|nr:RNA polymerase sigma-70 factor [Parabacteroides sp. TM07-1AC]RHU29399.1 RNA polymerase sigma-70 factor [Parabacteroides sp. TM07-1AC]
MGGSEDIKELSRLLESYKGRFISFANSYVQEFSVAEDFTMEAFMDYWEMREMLQPDSNVPAYILTLIKHKCLNHLKRKQLQEDVSQRLRTVAEWELNLQISSLEVCEPTELFTTEIKEIVNRTLQQLPEQTRRIFLMSRFENKTRKEIADELNMTSKGVEYHISKALAALRVNLKDYYTILPFLFYNLKFLTFLN